MKTGFYRLFLTVCTTFFIMQNASASNEKLADLLENNRNLMGRFLQVTYDESGAETQQSAGDFILDQPNRFVWKTVEPFPQQIISDGKTITVWDIDLEQATQKSFTKALGNSPAALLSQPANEVLPNYRIQQSGNNRFILQPINEDGVFSNLTLVFERRTISSMKFGDSLGQTTTITFQGLTHHNGISDDTFEIDLPSDVDLIIEGQ